MKIILTILSKTFLFTIVLFLLIINIGFNIFGVADSNYRFFDRVDELFVISRIHLADSEGLLNCGALPGVFADEAYTDFAQSQDQYNTLGNKYTSYMNGTKMSQNQYHAYRSHPGGQANLYALLQIILPFNNTYKLYLFRLITIFLSALCITLFIGWAYRNYGFVTATVTFILVLNIPMIIAFAYNLWWAYWSYYIPFLTMLLVLERRRNLKQKLYDWKLLVYLAIASFLKFFFTGAEFITASMTMAIFPILYYMLLENKQRVVPYFYFIIKAGIASLVGVALGFALLIAQIKSLTGTWREGIDHIITAFFRRSIYAETGDYEFSIMGVIKQFWSTPPFGFQSIAGIPVTYASLIILISILCLVLYLFKSKLQKIECKASPLAITTFCSILAPLSWIVIFTQHSMYHTLDIIVMYMPYLLWGFVVIGVFFDKMIHVVIQKIRGDIKYLD